jgi:hypothetical protein
MFSDGMIQIKLESDDEFLFQTFSDIPSNLYPQVTSIISRNWGISTLPSAEMLPNLKILDCSCSKISFIPEYPKLEDMSCIRANLSIIGDFPNLKVLYVQDNNITSIGNCPNLEILYCRRNILKELQYYPNLITLDCAFNQISEIPFYPELKSLSCHYNNLTSLPYFPNIMSIQCDSNQITELPMYEHIVSLSCSDNLITSILEYNTLHRLLCQRNLLTRLPQVHTWNNLRELEYSDNEIDYIPPHIVRFINRLFNHNKRRRIAVYTDGQNVHNHQIQSSIQNSIENIIKDKPNVNYDIMFQEILNNRILSDTVKEILIDFSDNEEMHSVLEIKFKELLLSVWSIIRNHAHKDSILEIFNTEMTDAICKCFTGRISRLINVLNGFDHRVKVEMADNEQIGNVVILIQNQLETEDNYSVEKHRELVALALTERGFSSDVINLWVNSIE